MVTDKWAYIGENIFYVLVLTFKNNLIQCFYISKVTFLLQFILKEKQIFFIF